METPRRHIVIIMMIIMIVFLERRSMSNITALNKYKYKI